MKSANGNGNEEPAMWKWKRESESGNRNQETEMEMGFAMLESTNHEKEHFPKSMISQGCEHVKTYFSESDHFHDFHIVRGIILSEMMLGIKIRSLKRKPTKWKTLENVVKRMVFATSPGMKVRKILLSEEFRLGTFHTTTIHFEHISKTL